MDLLVKKFSRLHCKDLLNTEVSSLQRFKQFVWVDETGSDDRNRRMKFGYSLRGEPPVCHHLLHCGRRISAIAAMSTDGVVVVLFLPPYSPDMNPIEEI